MEDMDTGLRVEKNGSVVLAGNVGEKYRTAIRRAIRGKSSVVDSGKVDRFIFFDCGEVNTLDRATC